MPLRFPLPVLRARAQRLILPALFFLLAAAPAWADDWPTYRHDLARTSLTQEKLELPLALAWRFLSPQAPQAAWSDPIKIPHRDDYDAAFAPIVAQGLLYFGSSADDSVYALDLTTGQTRWRFTAGGPIRLAPQVEGGKLFFAADDGVVYCLDAVSGKQIWTFHAAPEADQIIGNNRMVSRWPARCGVLVNDGVVYTSAGTWPNEGVYLYALDAASGQELWCNDTAGFGRTAFHDSDTGNHQGEISISGAYPEGPLMAVDDMIIVPQGEGSPFRMDRHSGKIMSGFSGGDPGRGGTWSGIDQGKIYMFAYHRNHVLYLDNFDLQSGKFLGRTRPEAVPQPIIGGKRADLRQLQPMHVSALIRQGRIIARNAQSLAMAGDVLIQGEEGLIRALDEKGATELWRAPVHGKARELAIAAGRLIVSTDQGEISCFAPAAAAAATATLVHDAASKLPPAGPPQGVAAAALAQLQAAQLDRGYVLLLGDADGQVARALAGHTQLRIVSVLEDPAAVTALRHRLLEETACYGTRIHVQHQPKLEHLPYSHWLLNAIIVAAPVAGVSGGELYRILRPCGGLLLTPGLEETQAAALLAQTPAAKEELARLADRPALIRGQLPGALDYNTKLPGDQLARWPLRLLWYGGPSAEQLSDARSGEEFIQHTAVAFGRYFSFGERAMTAVDAYNGFVLWSRPLPRFWMALEQVDGVSHYTSGNRSATKANHWRIANRRSAGADDQFVYLTLGDSFFHGQGEGCFKLDARTGRQLALSAPWFTPESPLPPDLAQATGQDEPEAWTIALVDLSTAQSWPLPIDKDHEGNLTLAQDDQGLLLTLTTRDPKLCSLDFWDLYCDLRPAERRFGLYEEGVFQLRIRLAGGADGKPSCEALSPTPCPQIELQGSADAAGTRCTVRLTWKEIEKLTSARPTSLGFAAALSNNDGGVDEPIAQARLFCDSAAGGINNGWAAVALTSAVMEQLKTRPAIFADAAQMRSWRTAGARNVPAIEEEVRTAPRVHPFTGELVPRIYRSGTFGCGGPSFSSTAVFRRASKPGVGIYDFADDSGLRVYGGPAAACGNSARAALGLFLFSQARFRCDCNQPLRTSYALAPAEKRLHEDWTIFYERDVDTQVRLGHINLGAFGDRRDDDGKLWLAFPRDSGRGGGYPLVPGLFSAASMPGVWMRHLPGSIAVPLQMDADPALGPYRFNADRAGITGSERAWIYASGIRGIRKATLQLDFLPALVALTATDKVQVDGKLAEQAWQGDASAELPFTSTKVWLRHDQDNLYLAARRPAVINRLGTISPWAAKTQGEDAPVFKEDSFELFLSDARGEKVMHLGVSASGARLDALAVGAGSTKEDPAWNGPWQSAVTADDQGLIVEMAIPLTVLTAAGLDPSQLAVNVQMNQKDVSGDMAKYLGGEGRNWNSGAGNGEALCYLGAMGRERCSNFAALGLGTPPPPRARQFTVRLHFAEPDALAAGQRVFAVKIQGQVVVPALDVVQEAGGVRKALIREFTHISADKELTVEFIPQAAAPDSHSAAILSGLEIYDEHYTAPVAAASSRP